MKRVSLLLALLLAPRFAVAQPEIKPHPDAVQAVPREAEKTGAMMVFTFKPDNARALAMMGAFYNSVQMAHSYKGHFVFTQTTVKDGKTTEVNLSTGIRRGSKTRKRTSSRVLLLASSQ